MPRITISFSDNDFDRLKNSAQEMNLSLAEYLRKLIEIGSLTESQKSKNQSLNPGIMTPQPSRQMNKEYWEQSLLCAFESRYLLRYLVDNLNSQPQEKRDVVLQAVKEKAQAAVEKLIEAEV